MKKIFEAMVHLINMGNPVHIVWAAVIFLSTIILIVLHRILKNDTKQIRMCYTFDFVCNSFCDFWHGAGVAIFIEILFIFIYSVYNYSLMGCVWNMEIRLLYFGGFV